MKFGYLDIVLINKGSCDTEIESRIGIMKKKKQKTQSELKVRKEPQER